MSGHCNISENTRAQRVIKKYAKAALAFIYRLTRKPVQLWRTIALSQIEFDSAIKIGRHTYGLDSNTIILAPTINKPDVIIGNYCSIAPNVSILANADHRIDLPSTFPFKTRIFSLLERRKTRGYVDLDAIAKGNTIIGHDVWLGQNATVLSGVCIGTGAIIGANSVVTNDIPPYAIAVGNPAKVIKYRFTEEQIERMLATEWWNLKDETIMELEPYFYNSDISAFINAVEILKR